MSSPARANIDRSFTQEFCWNMERYLDEVFARSPDAEISGFWCDGVVPSSYDKELTFQNVMDTKKIAARAWIGEDGQTPHELIIHLGPWSFGNCGAGLDLTECLPDPELSDWVLVDVENKVVEVQLY